MATVPDFEFNLTPLPPPLDAFVEAVWAVRGHTFYHRETVLPNASIELMINFGARQRVLAFGDHEVNQDHDRYWLAGLQTEPLTIESVGDSDHISIRFRPGGAHALFGIPVGEFNDQVLDLDLLLGGRISALRQQLADVSDFPQRVEIIKTWLLGCLSPREYEHDLVQRALMALDQTTGSQRIGDICEQVGLSNKHMIAIFRQIVGLPPKAMARILRFHRLIEDVRERENVDWALLAQQFHYYDQSHLIREFRQFAGVAPSDYIARRTPDGTALLTEH
jgi:AraC-like DNA-binding protein